MTHCLRALVDERLINCLFHPVLRPRHDDVTPLPSRLSRSSGSGAVPRPAVLGSGTAGQHMSRQPSPGEAAPVGTGALRARDGRRCGGAGVLPRVPGGPGKPHRVAGFPGTDQKKREVNGYAALFAKRSRVAKSPVRFSRAVMFFNTR